MFRVSGILFRDKIRKAEAAVGLITVIVIELSLEVVTS